MRSGRLATRAKGMICGAAASWRVVWAHLREVAGFGTPTKEDFGLELARLGLLGRRFGPGEYAAALGTALGVRISVEDFPDASLALAGRELLEEGTLAEVFYDEAGREALVLVRESLKMRPWPAYDLAVYHELSHLAARHPVRVKAGEEEAARGGRRARLDWAAARSLAVDGSQRARGVVGRGPCGEARGELVRELRERVFEPEAARRARWLVVAGVYPDVFENALGVDRLLA